MNHLIHLYLFHYIYRKLNTYMKISCMLLLSGFIIYQEPTIIMEFIKVILLIDIIFNTLYQLVLDNIYIDIRNNLISIYIMWTFIHIIPDEYRLESLLRRYTVHRYGLIN